MRTGFGARIFAFIDINSRMGAQMSVLDRERISTLSISDDLGDLQFISFDVETTGLSPVVARLVELSGVKFKLFDSEVATFVSDRSGNPYSAGCLFDTRYHRRYGRAGAEMRRRGAPIFGMDWR